MLGERQWVWLEAQLRVPGPKLRVIATSIQFGIEYNGWCAAGCGLAICSAVLCPLFPAFNCNANIGCAQGCRGVPTRPGARPDSPARSRAGRAGRTCRRSRRG
jgi:hypothetical protein